MFQAHTLPDSRTCRSTQRPRLRLACAFASLGWIALASSTGIAQESNSIRFVDRTTSSQLDFRHHDGDGSQYLFQLMSAGMASLDYDNDGLLDLYFLNGNDLPDATSTHGNVLYRNLGKFQFRACGRVAGAADVGFGLGVAVADYDQDGFADLFLSNFGKDCLLRNNGDGTFSDVTRATALGDRQAFGAGVVWADFNGDQLPDLFVGQYVDFTFERHAVLAPQAFPFPPGPKDFAWLSDALYLNGGNGRFEDVSQSWGLAEVRAPSMGTIAGDFDADGDTDVFVACDGAPNLLYRNENGQAFTEAAVQMGVAYDLLGQANGSMGVDAADLNQDLVGDLFVTDYTDQFPMLFLSFDGAGYEDATRRTNIGGSIRPHVNWSTGLIDLDNDGDRDAFVCNGHFLRNAHELTSNTRFGVRNSVLENIDGRFRPLEVQTEDPLAAEQSSRGAVFDDLDGDGDIDVVVLNCGDQAQLLENATDRQPGNWLQLDLRGSDCNRDALGAQIRLQTSSGEQVAEVRSGRGYQSHCGSRLHFGLGAADTVEVLQIDWPDGSQSSLENVAANRLLLMIQESP